MRHETGGREGIDDREGRFREGSLFPPPRFIGPTRFAIALLKVAAAARPHPPLDRRCASGESS